MKTIETKKGTITFEKEFYVIVSNNGNHAGSKRIWNVWSNGYEMKIKALNELRREIANNGDLKYGLKQSRIVTPEQLAEIINSDNIVKFMDCFDLSIAWVPESQITVLRNSY